MAGIDGYIRFLRKEYLQFDSRRKKKHEALRGGLAIICRPEEFHFIESDVLQALYVRLIEYGVMGKAHYNYNCVDSFELSVKWADRKLLGDKLSGAFSSDWLYVLPLDWMYTGGFLIDAEVFFANFLHISALIEDDFDVYEKNLNSSILFRGDRIGDEFVTYNITCRGEYFSFFKTFMGKS